MVVLLLIGFVLVILLWLIFAPVRVIINTGLNKYEVGQWGTINVSFHPDSTRKVSIRVLGFSVKLKRKEGRKLPEKAVRRKNRKRATWRSRKSLSAWWYLMYGVYNSVRMRRLVLNVDLDDVVWNAQLTPIILILNRRTVEISTNLNNLYFLNLEVDLRVYRVLWTVLIFFFKH